MTLKLCFRDTRKCNSCGRCSFDFPECNVFAKFSGYNVCETFHLHVFISFVRYVHITEIDSNSHWLYVYKKYHYKSNNNQKKKKKKTAGNKYIFDTTVKKVQYTYTLYMVYIMINLHRHFGWSNEAEGKPLAYGNGPLSVPALRINASLSNSW